ncbi:MAG: YkgJ family cysteine cluster protein [Acidimicrobiia bacterium]
MSRGPEAGAADRGDVPAGGFSAWLREMQDALVDDGPVDVPCGGCTACCMSSHLVPIAPDETEALSRIPAGALTPAPGMPDGHVLLGYDAQGRCSMLADGRCSIYEHRPRTCRTYDCRIFAAGDIEIDDVDKALVAARARRWRFDYPTALDRAEHDAVRSAARFLESQEDVLPDAPASGNPTQRAVIAIQAHGAFLRREPAGGEDVPVVLAGRRRGRPPS